MGSTRMSSTRLCQPQDRNIHGKIFGGYLMREAYELGLTNALLFANGPVLFVAQDDITFRKVGEAGFCCRSHFFASPQPVELGSIVELTSRIVLSEGSPRRSFQVQVTADVVDPATAARDTTNTFHFSFVSERPLRPIMPVTYEEGLTYIESFRRRQVAMATRDTTRDLQSLILPAE